VLDWLTKTSHFSQRHSGERLSVRTQDHTDENGIPDIRIEADDVDVIIEVKLGGDLTSEQVDAYLRELEQRGRPYRALVALMGSAPTEPLPGLRFVVRLWGDLGVKLGEEAHSSELELTRYLVTQFHVLLNHLHLTPLRVRSRLSKALSAHRQWVEANPERPSIFKTRIRSIERLKDMPDTEPLRQLLLQMDSVLGKASGVKSYKFDSGPNMDEPWIGFNVNNMAYFFYLELAEPETIYLQRYGRAVDPASFDGSFGELEATTPRITHWSAKLDLLEPSLGFFEANEFEQERKIGEFLARALAFGESLRPLSDATV
jgi:hypothetical protein